MACEIPSQLRNVANGVYDPIWGANIAQELLMKYFKLPPNLWGEIEFSVNGAQTRRGAVEAKISNHFPDLMSKCKALSIGGNMLWLLYDRVCTGNQGRKVAQISSAMSWVIDQLATSEEKELGIEHGGGDKFWQGVMATELVESKLKNHGSLTLLVPVKPLLDLGVAKEIVNSLLWRANLVKRLFQSEGGGIEVVVADSCFMGDVGGRETIYSAFPGSRVGDMFLDVSRQNEAGSVDAARSASGFKLLTEVMDHKDVILLPLINTGQNCRISALAGTINGAVGIKSCWIVPTSSWPIFSEAGADGLYTETFAYRLSLGMNAPVPEKVLSELWQNLNKAVKYSQPFVLQHVLCLNHSDTFPVTVLTDSLGKSAQESLETLFSMAVMIRRLGVKDVKLDLVYANDEVGEFILVNPGTLPASVESSFTTLSRHIQKLEHKYGVPASITRKTDLLGYDESLCIREKLLKWISDPGFGREFPKVKKWINDVIVVDLLSSNRYRRGLLEEQIRQLYHEWLANYYSSSILMAQAGREYKSNYLHVGLERDGSRAWTLSASYGDEFPLAGLPVINVKKGFNFLT